MHLYTAVAAALLSLPMVAAADSMRCGKWVVNEDSSAAEVLRKCGEPQRKDVSKQDVWARNAAGYTHKIGVQVIERWYYKRSPGSLPMLVTVIDGDVKRIERTE